MKCTNESKVKLFRAISFFNGEIKQQNPYIKTPRKPRDTDKELHQITDRWFKKKFGVYARSETIFCSRSRMEASKYLVFGGRLLEIEIPEHKSYVAIYSLLVTDLYSETSHLKPPYNELEINDLLESKSYKSTNDLSVIPSYFTGEIMLSIDEFLAREV
jgi:hypothetical protein